MNQYLNFSLKGKVALVTGASYGIGFAIASAFAEQGATVCFNDINQELVDKGMAAYAAKGIKAHGYVCDVTDEPAVQAMVATIAKEVGTIDILVNNAGIIRRVPMHEMEAADFRRVIDIDLSAVRPTVAFPHLPENTRTIDEIGRMDKIKIDQVVIGSCTNGRYSDLEAAAAVVKGKHVAKGVRAIVIPATQQIYLDALRSGLLETFVEAGMVVSAPTCGPCLGGHMGILAPGERAVSTTNRNFVGRMGDVTSEVYLASPAIAAASALTGYISDVQE